MFVWEDDTQQFLVDGSENYLLLFPLCSIAWYRDFNLSFPIQPQFAVIWYSSFFASILRITVLALGHRVDHQHSWDRKTKLLSQETLTEWQAVTICWADWNGQISNHECLPSRVAKREIHSKQRQLFCPDICKPDTRYHILQTGQVSLSRRYLHPGRAGNLCERVYVQ